MIGFYFNKCPHLQGQLGISWDYYNFKWDNGKHKHELELSFAFGFFGVYFEIPLPKEDLK